ncbi:hypothetical protein EHQ12_17790 [Leptospira gomenensis]|uniref:Uncharacterized protein n=1 Tax=Leptospira gomenensis TaxID=2484974 RepID=A0A5F1YSH2_9LEPT|nr:hypothetical protein [Leptospira gomenensis]TGK33194.1 hypothetical protein EHQ12_17790 [Leptospira gomenensis]TGK35572.1 hypothetical protein EHQ17_06535 [Leptospira gomenensis]TGK40896.1 hypothetical protein EHQ07_17495 [Leptospira gomenensis]TGK61186.1 hypothetical protein EHQ13_10030 [Leptospira gomenensis]
METRTPFREEPLRTSYHGISIFIADFQKHRPFLKRQKNRTYDGKSVSRFSGSELFLIYKIRFLISYQDKEFFRK